MVTKCSGWLDVSSEVPQGSVLGSILFKIFINDIEDGICGYILKFKDHIKLFCKVCSDENCAKLIANLRKLYDWLEDRLANVVQPNALWLQQLNNIFLLGSYILKTVDEERDLGVMIRKYLKASSQCVKVVKAANQVLGMIKRTFTFTTKDNLLQ